MKVWDCQACGKTNYLDIDGVYCKCNHGWAMPNLLRDYNSTEDKK